MKNRLTDTMPKPSRGIMAQIARERGVSINAVVKSYMKRDPATVLAVAKLERQIKRQRRKAIQTLIKSIDAS
jgi:hypothetical protein